MTNEAAVLVQGLWKGSQGASEGSTRAILSSVLMHWYRERIGHPAKSNKQVAKALGDA